RFRPPATWSMGGGIQIHVPLYSLTETASQTPLSPPIHNLRTSSPVKERPQNATRPWPDPKHAALIPVVRYSSHTVIMYTLTTHSMTNGSTRHFAVLSPS